VEVQRKIKVCICFFMRAVFSPRALYLGNEMTFKKITLNCLIVPIGKLMNIPCIKVMQAITINIRHDDFSELEAVIKADWGNHLIKSLSKFVKFNMEALLKSNGSG
jgi:hypothetical protein